MPITLDDAQQIAGMVVTGVGSITSILLLFGFACTAWLTLSGLMPVLIRLGRGLARRKIAIFANSEEKENLAAMLMATGFFKAKRVVHVANISGMGEAEKADVLLVYWPDWQADIASIIAMKKDASALIIFAPQSGPRVPPEIMSLIETKRNVVLSNLRGRLMNDVLLSMMTSGYEAK